MTREIPLTRGLVALVDDEDFAAVSGLKWYALPARAGSDRFYAARWAAGQHVYLHHAILGEIVEVDHVNRDPLDNRRANLRLCNRSQNVANRAPRGRLGLKGVSLCRRSGLYRATARHAGRYYWGGYHATPEAAARAYDLLAKRLHGEFAFLNFPEAA